MDAPERPKDIIDAVEELAAASGNFQNVGPEYYESFLSLTPADVCRLVVFIMVDQEREVRRLAGGQTDSAAVAQISKFVRNNFTGISIGIARFDPFGRFGFVARIGPEPTPEMHDAMQERMELIAPVVTNTVRQTLPWLLSRDDSQT